MHSYSAKQRRGGFVLVMVLLIISLAAISLAGLARKSFLLASEAAEAHADLQRRWGTISCRRAILDRAEELLSHAAEAIDRLPEPAVIWGEFSLGGLNYAVQLADEDAKANLNVMAKHDPDAAQGALYQAQWQAADLLDVRLRTARGEGTLVSWGQAFDLATEGAARQVQEMTEHLTLWGSGKLNIRRASDEAVRQVCGLVLRGSQVGELLELRQEEWTDLEQLINQLDLQRKERGAVRRLLADRSKCYSLWINGAMNGRSWSSLEVANPGTGTPYLTFAW